MLDKLRFFKNRLQAKNLLLILIVLLAFLIPVSMLYFFDPERDEFEKSSFEIVWKGRLPLLLFLWLLFLEVVLGWEWLSSGRVRLSKIRLVFLVFLVAAPTVYVVGKCFFGFGEVVREMGEFFRVPYKPYYVDPNHYDWQFKKSWPFSVEYLFFAAIFTLLVLLLYRVEGLKIFSVSTFFIWAFGFFYTVDTYYYEGSFAPLQLFVPIITYLSVSITNWLGYDVKCVGPDIIAVPNQEYPYKIDWPCAGIHSMVIYSCVILLFLKGATFSPKWKFVIFIVGAVGTFFVNVFRIVTILVLAAQGDPKAADLFHEYGGAVYFMIWLCVFLIAIVSIQKFLLYRRASKKELAKAFSSGNRVGENTVE